MVASGTKKARATSAVVSPPSVRSVSATRTSSGRAGWQQVKISLRRSSPSDVSGSGSLSAASSRPWSIRNASSLLPRSRPTQAVDRTAPRRRDQPPTGIAREAVDRPTRESAGDRILQRILRKIEVAENTDQNRENAARLLAKNALERGSGRVPLPEARSAVAQSVRRSS